MDYSFLLVYYKDWLVIIGGNKKCLEQLMKTIRKNLI